MTATVAQTRPNNPFEIARRNLIDSLSTMAVPLPIANFPYAEDFEAVADHLRQAAAIFDAWLQDIGAQVKMNAPCRIDDGQFDCAFSGAIAGNATFETQRCAEIIRDEQQAMGFLP
jgi:hypothetical protein